MLLTNPNTIFPLLSFFLFLSQAQDTIQPISTNLSDSELAISLTPTDQSDAVDRLPIPSDPHTEPYPEYTLRYKHYQKPYTEAEKAQKFLMYCNVLFTNKVRPFFYCLFSFPSFFESPATKPSTLIVSQILTIKSTAAQNCRCNQRHKNPRRPMALPLHQPAPLPRSRTRTPTFLPRNLEYGSATIYSRAHVSYVRL